MFKGTILLILAAACFAQDQKQSADTSQTQQMQENMELRKELKELKDAKAVKPPAHFYKLDFVLKEVDGDRVLNSRAYSMTMSTESTPSSIRAIAKTAEGVDTGVQIDVRNLREIQNEVSLNLMAKVTGVGEKDAPSHSVVREFQWGSDVLVPARKPTVVYRSESTTSTSQMEVEVTATPLM
jgi:hypothetical protein